MTDSRASWAPLRPGQNEALADSGVRHTRTPTHHFAFLPETLQSVPIILRIKSHSSALDYTALHL